LGSSTKGIAQTGEKGVGFKSAFVLSSRPHILSNPYRPRMGVEGSEEGTQQKSVGVFHVSFAFVAYAFVALLDLKSGWLF
jgi:hypothetical protein